jgi:hypothetical protein
VKTGLGNGIAVDVAAVVAEGVGDSSPVMGTTGGAVWVWAAARVWATAVLITFGSAVAGMGGAQAWTAINNRVPRKRFRIVFNILPPFRQQLALSRARMRQILPTRFFAGVHSL